MDQTAYTPVQNVVLILIRDVIPTSEPVYAVMVTQAQHVKDPVSREHMAPNVAITARK